MLMLKNHKTLGTNFFLNLLVTLYFVPVNFINPYNSGWVFAKNSLFRDLSGHAIGSMFYAVDDYRNPIGVIGNYGSSVGSTTLFWNSNPLLSLFQKILFQNGLIPRYFQFIGIELFVGLLLTGLSVYLATKKLGGSDLSALLASNLSVISTSLLAHYFNDSLTWQFLIVFSFVLFYEKVNNKLAHLRWFLLLALTISSQAYFFPIVGAVYLLWLLLNLRRHIAISGFSAFLASAISAMVYYQIGGFVLPLSERITSLKSAQELSCTLECLFDSRTFGLISLGSPNTSSWEGWRYLGISVVFLFLISTAKSIVDSRAQTSRVKSRIFYLYVLSFLFFILSLGPVIQFHGKTLSLPENYFLDAFFMSFRATGRFAIPLVLVITIHSALQIDRVRNLQWKKIAAILLIVVQIFEMTRLYESIAYDVNRESKLIFVENVKLDSVFARAKSFEVIEAHSGDVGNIPWQEFSYFALKYNLPINSWHFLARYDVPTAAKEQYDSVKFAENCLFQSNSIYLINSSIYERIPSTCKGKLFYVTGANSWNYYFHR